MRNLRNMFEELEYEIENPWVDINALVLEKKLKTLMNSIDSKEYGCLMFFAMCHASGNYLHLHESELEREKIYEYFLTIKHMKNVATIIFHNNCRVKTKGKFCITFYEKECI